jgi:hypothetical protein
MLRQSSGMKSRMDVFMIVVGDCLMVMVRSRCG